MIIDLDIIVVISILVAFYVAWSIGANDETMAIAVSTGLAGVGTIVALGAIMDFFGALFASASVEETMGVKLLAFEITEVDIFIILLAIASWLVLVSYYGWPASTTHSAVGAAIGLASFKIGFKGVNWSVLGEVMGGWVLSPVIGLIGAYVFSILIDSLYRKLKVRNLRRDVRILRVAAYVLILWALYTSYYRGGNDSANATAFLLRVYNEPLTVRFIGGVGIALGLIILGRRVVKNVGKELVELDPLSGLAVQLSVALILSIGTILGFPLSGTHILVSAVAGVGLARRLWINVKNLKEIIITWIITFPGAAVFAILISLLVYAFIY